MKSITIVDAGRRGTLKLEPDRNGLFWVEVNVDGKSVREQSYACPCCDGFSEFFEDLAATTGRWKAARTWTPPIGGLAIRAAQEGSGQVALALELTPYSKPDDRPHKATLRVAREDLRRIAEEVKNLFQAKKS